LAAVGDAPTEPSEDWFPFAHVNVPDPLFVRTWFADPCAEGNEVVTLFSFVILPEELTTKVVATAEPTDIP
jgi:hypothetical protein